MTKGKTFIAACTVAATCLVGLVSSASAQYDYDSAQRAQYRYAKRAEYDNAQRYRYAKHAEAVNAERYYHAKRAEYYRGQRYRAQKAYEYGY